MKQQQSITISPDEHYERRRQIVSSLHDEEYRHEFVKQQVEVGVPFQIKGMRKAREWNQADLGNRLGKPQSVVSRLEDPNYGKFTISTLYEIAKAFDVGLLVTFVPFGSLADRAAGYSVTNVEVPEFCKDPGVASRAENDSTNVVSITGSLQRRATGASRSIEKDVTDAFDEQTEDETTGVYWVNGDNTNGVINYG